MKEPELGTKLPKPFMQTLLLDPTLFKAHFNRTIQGICMISLSILAYKLHNKSFGRMGFSTYS